MKAYTQKTYRVEAKKAEQIDSIRIDKGLSWNGIMDLAFDMLMEKITYSDPPLTGNDLPNVYTDIAETPDNVKEPPIYDTATEGHDLKPEPRKNTFTVGEDDE